MNFPFEKVIRSLDELKDVAFELSKCLKEGDLVVLNGELGCGKTTLVKLICEFYKVEDVVSPSFSIVNEYNALKRIYHFDFYRLKRIEELFDIGFEDYMNESDVISFIEWGYLMRDIIPSDHYEIKLDMLQDEKRRIKVLKHS